MPHLRALARVVLLWLLTSTPQTSAQEQVWYQVEVVIFQHQAGQTAPLLMRAPGIPRVRHPQELLPAQTWAVRTTANVPPRFVAYQDAPGRHLARVYHSLQNSPHYRPLLYKSWRLTPATSGRFVRLGRYRNEHEPTTLSQLPPNVGQAVVKQLWANMNDVTFVRALDPIVHGFVRTRIEQHLDVDLDFGWFPGVSADDSGSQPGVRIKRSRRIKLAETHYFDHPVLSVLLQVQKLEDL